MIVERSAFRVSLFGRRTERLLFFTLLLLSGKIFAQHTLPLTEEYAVPTAYFFNNSDGHSTIQPAVDADLRRRKVTGDSAALQIPVYANRLSWDKYYVNHRAHPYSESFVPVKSDYNFGFLLRPIYDFQFGKELKDNRTLLTTAGGIILDADYKQKLGIELRFAGGMTVLPNYQDSIAQHYGVIPGWGDKAIRKDANGRYTFSHFSGNIVWRPSKVFNLQIGRDKHFWGDGHRSLFLSDLSAAYPYIQQQTTIWKLQYTSMFAWLKSPTDTMFWGNVYPHYANKFGTFHYLSFNAAKWLNLGVFESVIWQGEDQNRYRGFDVNYLNPIVFFRPVEYSLGSSDNAMLGFAMKVRFNANNLFYSQIILDEFYLKEIRNWKQGWWANKQGIQLGYKCFNFAQVQNFFLQAELNIVRPYTYSHGSPQQNYSNAGMPLAHPLGANFAELFGLLQYQWNGLTVAGKLVGARMGVDPAGKNFGQDIFASYITRSSTDPAHPTAVDYNHHLFDGVATNIFYAEFKAAYRFNTAFPLRLELTAGARRLHNVNTTQRSSYVMAGLSLPLWKASRDY